jgi:8-oxo-dGTP pyrophosphatase MutT (NUDIX family)
MLNIPQLTKEKQIVQAVGALVYSKKTKRYLFLLRNSHKYSGSWGLVGGKVEAGERITEALYRESMEELSYDLTQNKIIPIETFTSDGHKFIYYTFLVSVDDEFVPILNHEHRGFCWVGLADYPKPLHPGVWRTFKFSTIIDKISILERLL